MKLNFLNLTGLTTFFNQLKQKFATTSEVSAVEADTETYVLNVDYESFLAFDITEIVASEDDIALEENEAMLLSSNDDVLVDINDAYITIEGGE